ncbi:hypothetical protein TNCV_2929601 [Trichonephila clavipes]|nr:hypothetical protein TNCV_2929601 [Trichonephila clavipes]
MCCSSKKFITEDDFSSQPGRQNPVDTAYDVGSILADVGSSSLGQSSLDGTGCLEGDRYYPNFEGEQPGRGSGASHLFLPSTNLARELAAGWLFRVPRKSKIHLQTSMPSEGYELRPCGTAVSVANH